MNKTITIGLVAILVLFIIGCAQPSPITPEAKDTAITQTDDAITQADKTLEDLEDTATDKELDDIENVLEQI